MILALRCSIRRLSAFLALVALLPVVPQVMAQVMAQQMVSVSGKDVNLRSGPGTHHPADWTLSRGYPLEVIRKQGDWLEVRDFENDKGWIYRPLVSNTPHHVVKVKAANLRSEPTTGSRIVARLAYGDILKTLESRSDWVKVQRSGGLRGWVARRLVWGW
jgi:SH3-like domain-containing protein